MHSYSTCRSRLFQFHVQELHAIRLWGILPPERAATNARQANSFALAKRLGYEAPQASYATGKGTAPAVHIERAPVTAHKDAVDTVKTAPPKPAAQHPARPTDHQNFVEEALHKLKVAKWIDHDPGDPSKVNDDATKAAIREFQQKFDATPVDGIAGPITRRALQKALEDLAAGKPAPHEPPKKPQPRLDRVVWLKNRVPVGGTAYLAAEGTDLDNVELFHVTLKDRTTNHSEKVDWPFVLVNDIGVRPVAIPTVFQHGAELLASFSAVGRDGTQMHVDHQVPLYIGEIVAPAPGDWPWNEQLWTKKMRDIVADLRATKAQSGPFQRFEITQFGVKEKIDPGDVEVRSAKGEVFGRVTKHSLMLADIEGTMRLDGKILNITRSGNVYEPKDVIVDGKKVIKNKPVPEKFDPANSLWTDVTARAPWGAGSRTPLIPFRTLAINPRLNSTLYYKKVYIKQLDGLQLSTGERHNGVCIVGDAGGMRQTHFDCFVGREDRHIQIPSVGTGDSTICEIQLLDECAAARPGSA